MCRKKNSDYKKKAELWNPLKLFIKGVEPGVNQSEGMEAGDGSLRFSGSPLFSPLFATQLHRPLPQRCSLFVPVDKIL